jgi:DNA-binding transcriptional LysR family regulator
MDSLTGITSFVEAAEALSFVAAGRRLGISPSAVGKNVAKLEQALGVRLFQRTTRRIALTHEGTEFHLRCRQILEDLRDAQAAMAHAGQAPQGRLRIGLPTIGYRFLLPVLPDFRRAYPGIELDLDFNDRIVDLIEEGLDAVIRSGDLVDSSLIARRLGAFSFVLCAAPAYLARTSTPATPGDLAAHQAIRFRFPTTGRLQDWALTGCALPPLTTALTCSNMEAVRAAAINGMGIAYMPDFLAHDALNSGALVTLLDDHRARQGQFSVLWPSNRLISAKLRAFVDFASERLFKVQYPAPVGQ